MTLPKCPPPSSPKQTARKSLLPFKRCSRSAAEAHLRRGGDRRRSGLAKGGAGAPTAAEVGQEGSSSPAAAALLSPPPGGRLARFPAAEPAAPRREEPPRRRGCWPRCRNRRFRHVWLRGWRAAGPGGAGRGGLARRRPGRGARLRRTLLVGPKAKRGEEGEVRGTPGRMGWLERLAGSSLLPPPTCSAPAWRAPRTRLAADDGTRGLPQGPRAKEGERSQAAPR